MFVKFEVFLISDGTKVLWCLENVTDEEGTKRFIDVHIYSLVGILLFRLHCCVQKPIF